jgi:hypothetical protein
MPGLFSTSSLQRAARLVWGVLLLTLPVTSFRYMPDFFGRTLIQPLAFYPLAILLVLLALLFWRERRVPLPPNIKLLLAFVVFAAIASAVSMLFATIPLRDAEQADRILRGWFSLFVGMAFFFAAFWMNRTEGDLQHSLRWIYAALGLTVAWSLVQAIAVNTSLIPRSLVNDIQTLFSARPLLPRRISGFAYEPAWLADQIVIFFLPWTFAALISGRSLFKRRWVEGGLVLLLLSVLVFTYSRGGLLTALACLAIVFVLFGRQVLGRVWAWIAAPFSGGAAISGLALRLVLLAAVVISLVAAGSFLARYEYFASVWDLGDEDNPVDYLVDISAGPRLAYAMAGYGVYEDNPLTGVGLGASGLYLFEHYPEWASNIPEVARQLAPDSNLIPNTKNLYIRLLAELGLPGFWLFVAFLVSFLAIIRRMAVSGHRFLQFVAAAGTFIWIGVAARNITQDSFTVPIMWVALGLLVGLYPFQLKEFRPGIRVRRK